MKRWPLAFMVMLLSGCGGGGDDGPTGPRPPANVQGSWTATSTVHTITEGALCVSTSLSRPTQASITQNGSSIALNITFTGNYTCSFSGTINDTAISWTLDQQQASPVCRLNVLGCANPDGTIRFFFSNEVRSSGFNGSVSGDQISVAGETVSTLTTQNGSPAGTLRVATSIVLQRQR